MGSILEEMRRFYIGGVPALSSIRHSGVPFDDERKFVAKTNMVTIPSGEVIVRFEILHRAFMEAKSKKIRRRSRQRSSEKPKDLKLSTNPGLASLRVSKRGSLAGGPVKAG